MLRLFRHYVSPIALALAAGDVVIILAAVSLANAFSPWIGGGALWPKIALLTTITVLALYLADLYDTALQPGRRELGARLLLAVTAGAAVTAAASFAVPALRFGRAALFGAFGALTVGLFVWRSAWVGTLAGERLRKRVLVLGVSGAAHAIGQLQACGARPYRVLGFLDDDLNAQAELPPGAELLGKTGDLLNLAEELQPDVVLVALPEMRGAFPAADLLECRLRGIQVEDWPTFYEKQTGRLLLAGMRPSWLIFADGFVKSRLTRGMKRAVDLVVATLGLILTIPALVLVAVLIKVDSRGPVLFRQKRVGQHGRIFVMNKFRSMRPDAEHTSGPVWAARADPRVTRIGRFLRRTRLDELPQLVNVLVGHMSLIGPRPERPEFVQMLRQQIPFYMERLTVKPGITGWAQVRHAYTDSVATTLEKLQYDLYYVKNLSAFLDVLILLNTIQVVLFRRGSR